MGMFDEVIADFKCPYCAYELSAEEIENTLETKNETWQTKATIKLLEQYKVGDKLKFRSNVKINDGSVEIHHICPSCKKFVSADIEVKNNRLSDKIMYRVENQ
jgi:hypothetical protein